MNARTRQVVEELDAATLEQLQARFPERWRAVGAMLVAATGTGRPEALAELVQKTADAARPWRARLQRPGAKGAAVAAVLPHLASARMAKLAAEQVLRTAAARLATGKQGTGGGELQAARARLGLWTGMVIQRLMFARGLERKPVSMTAFRLLWPLLPDRRLLMPLVQPKGIYCFYTAALIAALAKLVGARQCLEVAAGDGTLTRFLSAAGVTVHAVDDGSWAHAITYPAEVERLDAAAALRRDRPAAVLCSFPPPGNDFEQQIFRSPGVELYVVLTTRHHFAAGDWQAYEQQGGFDRVSDATLSRLLLPPELDPEVLVFRRH